MTDPEEGQTVFVYYNLHKHCLSIQDKSRIVIAYRDKAVLKDATFMVAQGGRQRVIESGQKNVHARIKGTWTSQSPDMTKARRVRYNPFQFATFVYADTEEPILKSEYVVVDGKTIWAL